jgi:hypothetical protein
MRLPIPSSLRSLPVGIALALVSSACASDGDPAPPGSAVPAFEGVVGPGSEPVPGPAPASGDAVDPAASDSTPSGPMAGDSTSERPVVTERVEPSGDGDGAEGDPAESGDVDGPAGGDPETPASEPRPSAACGNGGAPPSFDLPNTLFSLPASYDGNAPLPVVIAFHAAGNPNTQMRGIIGNAFDDDYILLYPKSDGNGWSNRVDAPKVDAIFDALDALACYDRNRVFATGHSSGAQFIVQRLCAGESRWRAVAPVASSVYCSSWQPIPALVIHGIGDVEREAYGLDDGDGLKDIVPYRTSNGCQESSVEVVVDGCNSGGVQVSPGCRDFDGCGQTTRWCQHDDPQYGTSHHGVPCFGARVMKQFFDGYR